MIRSINNNKLANLQCKIFAKKYESEIMADIKKYKNIQKLFGFSTPRFYILGKKSKLYQLSQTPGFESCLENILNK